MDPQYIPVDELVPGKWYAVKYDPSHLPDRQHGDDGVSTLLRFAIAGPFESEAAAAEWFDEHQAFGGEHAHVRQVPSRRPENKDAR